MPVLTLTLAVVLFGAVPAGADPADDKSRVDAELAQTSATLEAATSRAQQAVAQYAQANAQLPGAQNMLADARGRVAAAEVVARQADREAAAADEVKTEAAKEYQSAAVKVDESRAHVGEFVSQTYRGSGFLALNSILESGSPSEFANRVGYLNQVAAGKTRALNALTVARAQAKEREDAAEVARQRADQSRQQAQQALAASRAAQAGAEQAATDVQNLITQRQQAIDVANQERTAVLANYDRLKAESDRIAAELREAAKNRNGGSPPPTVTPPSGGGAFFMMPTAGWKSSDYGMRYDPYYKVWQLHAGMDIAAPSGQVIYAAADGRVVRAGWNGGYGNYTCISHGNYQGRDLATCYGHQSAMMVSAGQYVRRGQAIGRVGSTGASTGAHLHFEVRRDGTPENPQGWLPACLC
ncbi:M23 family metallopeptidase [Planosporangium mesophilum]|uniref:Peptidase M23 n=1 Tax=Planosporangium mesophilum TaxID=689768 RepID=A0A8J3TEA8_9ACTN|nr:M23 family metallopeptidase [Planosporangium mesophilum]NJC84938.1 M23 family metallopeptidase [Planosporangium mesophilum]GII23592.1 peptidase M23 [Planosporangium mesophilum]